MSDSSREAAGMLVGCAGSYALLIGAFPTMSTSRIGVAFLLGMFICAVLLIVSLRRDHFSLLGSLTLTVLMGGVTFAVIYSVICSLMTHVPSSG